jgi:hypothetical protein
MNYMHHQIARAEHEVRIQTLKPVRDDTFQTHDQPDTRRRVAIERLRPVLTTLIHLLSK